MNPLTATFLIAARDRPGLVSQLAGFFARLGLNIVDASNHTDVHSEGGALFFMRLLVDVGGLATPEAHARLGGSATRRSLADAFGDLARELDATWSVAYSDVVQRLAILVTKDPSCLYDLILRER